MINHTAMHNKNTISSILYFAFAILASLASCEEMDTEEAQKIEQSNTANQTNDGQMLHIHYNSSNLLFSSALPAYKTTAVSSQGSDTAFFREEIRFDTENAECKIQFINTIIREQFAPNTTAREYFKTFNDANRLQLIKSTSPAFPYDISQYQSGIAIKLTLLGDEDKVYTSYKSDMFGNVKYQSEGCQSSSSNFTLDSVANPEPGTIHVSGRFNVKLFRNYTDSIAEDDYILIDNAIFSADL